MQNIYPTEFIDTLIRHVLYLVCLRYIGDVFSTYPSLFFDERLSLVDCIFRNVDGKNLSPFSCEGESCRLTVAPAVSKRSSPYDDRYFSLKSIPQCLFSKIRLLVPVEKAI